jgi:hypothetical protein
VTEAIYILPPHQVPSQSSLREWSRDATVPAFPSMTASNRVMADYLEQMAKHLPEDSSSPLASGGQPEDIAHDTYFSIRRKATIEPAVFARMVLIARVIFLRDVEQAKVTTSESVLSSIDQSLSALTECVFGAGVDAARHVTLWVWSEKSGDSMHRWVRGHQLFAALTQGLIFALQELGRGLREGRSQQVRGWSDLSANLLRGSAAAFQFTGDFPQQDYAEVIRPSMMPPQSEVGLSGLMSIDHRFLVQMMRDMRPALKALYEQEQRRHEELSNGLTSVYDSHIHVCERFVGKQPSILTVGRSERSGPSLIEQFKSLRLKPFEQPPRTTRLPHSTAAPAEAAVRCPFSSVK